MAKVTLIYNNDKKADLENYIPISVLLCFPKILEHLMYNCLFKYFTKNKDLYDTPFGFHNYLNKLLSRFEKSRYTLGIFIDVSKAFETVNHQILF